MNKTGKLYITLVILVILAIVALEMTKPKKINWYPSYATYHKIPYGSFVFNEQLKRLTDTVIPVDRPPFEYLKSNTINGTYIFYNGGIQFGKSELKSLLDWTAKGNTLVVAAVNFEEKLLDTLHLETESINIFENFNNQFQLQLVHPNLNSKTYTYDKASTLFHFNKIDTLNTKVIGVVDKYQTENELLENPLVNVIKQSFGEGQIILSTFPQAFTNYFILENPNQDYTAGLLSYIDTKKPIYLDQHYKYGKKFYTSPMYLFLSTKELKWAYYIVLIGALIYIIFEGKRKQRAIPIVKPLKNQTVDFTRTIANMYYESSKHKEISSHKVQHFLEYIRSHLYLNTSDINSTFIKNLAARSSNSIEDTEQLFKFIASLNKQTTVNNIQLEKLNSLIETFKSYSEWKTKT